SKSTYSNGIKIASVADKMLQVAKGHSSLPEPALIDLLCRHFHLAPFRFGPDASWPGKHPIGNHGKFWMVDERYFYIGSDNLNGAGFDPEIVSGEDGGDRQIGLRIRHGKKEPAGAGRCLRFLALSGEGWRRCDPERQIGDIEGGGRDKRRGQLRQRHE